MKLYTVTFDSLPSLEYLYLNNNYITNINLNLPSLSYLSLSNNPLTGIDPNVFNSIPLNCNIELNSCELTSDDVDNLLIKFDNDNRSDCYLYFNSNNGRSSASDASYDNLISRDCYIEVS